MSGCGRVVPLGLGLAHCHRLRLADEGICCLLEGRAYDEVS